MPSITGAAGGSSGGSELVQKWVDSIQSHDTGADEAADTDTVAACPDTSEVSPSDDKLVAVADTEDDLSLGAEARLLPDSAAGTEASLAAAKSQQRERALRWKDTMSASLRKRFAESLHQTSFASECSRQSFDQLVLEHRIDPERVLVNLGFLKRSEADPQRIPDQFLLYQSKARGMTCDSYLDEHPKVRQHLEQKLALENAFRGVNQPPPSPVPSQTDDVPEEPQSAMRSCLARSFGQVAQTVALIGRFRSRAQRRYVSFAQCFVAPVARKSSRGSRYWSILEEENSEFLDRHNYYQKDSRGPLLKTDTKTPVVKRSGWASIKAAAVAKSPCTVSDLPQISEKKSPTFAVPGTATGAPLSGQPRRSSNFELTQDSVDQDISSNIPARFMSRPSISLSPSQPLLKPHAEAGSDLLQQIPTIEINNNETERVLSRHSTNSGFEWYQSSSFSSSTTTEDMASPTSVDSYIHRLEEIRMARRMSAPEVDCDRLYLRVASDAASTVSGQTLVEDNGSFETPGMDTSDQAKITDTQVEHSRLRKSPELAPDSFEIEEVDSNDDIWTESLPPFNLTSKIRTVLRHQGSSQSDSSGFVESELMDSAVDSSTVSKTHPRRPIRQQQLTSRSFTTLDPDQSDDRRPNLILSQSHSADIMRVPDRLEIPTFSPTKPGTRLAPIGRAPARIDQSDKGTQTDDEKWMLQQKTYTTSLYIDSLAPSVNVPLEIQKDGKDTEVMIFLEGLNIESCRRPDSKFVPSAISSPQNGGKDEKRFVSTVELVSARAANGHLALTPVTSRSMEVTQGQPTVERSPKVVGRLSGQREAMSGVSDHHHLDSVVLDPMSYSEQQQQQQQHRQWLAEVTSVQCALAKCRRELSELMARTQLRKHAYDSPREQVEQLQRLQRDVTKQVDTFQSLLTHRMTSTVTLTSSDLQSVNDLGSLGVIHEMVQLLKEQLHQHSVVNLLSTTLPQSSEAVGDTGTGLALLSVDTRDKDGGGHTVLEPIAVTDGSRLAEELQSTISPLDWSAGARPPLLHSASLPSHYSQDTSLSDTSPLATVLMDRMLSLEERVVEQQRKSEMDIARLLSQFQNTFFEEMKRISSK